MAFIFDTAGSTFGKPSNSYRTPRPVYSDREYRAAQRQDFELAREAVGVSTRRQQELMRTQAGLQTGMMREQAGLQRQLMREQGSQQRSLMGIQAGLQREMQGAAIAGQERLLNAQMRNQGQLLDRQVAAQERLAGQSLAAQERMNDRRSRAMETAAGLGAVSAGGVAMIQGENQLRAIREQGRQQSQLMAQQDRIMQDRQMRDRIDPRIDQRNANAEANNRMRLQAQLQYENQSRLMQQAATLAGGGRSGVRGSTPATMGIMRGGTGGSVGGVSGGVNVSTPTRDYNNPSDNPALALAREQNTAAAARQAAQIAAGDRDRAERIAAQERMQSADLQYRREAPQIAANAEEDLRAKARKAALAVFNSAGRGRVLSAG